MNNPVIVHHQITRLDNDEDTTRGVKQAVEVFNDISNKKLKVNLIMDFSKAENASAYKIFSQNMGDWI